MAIYYILFGKLYSSQCLYIYYNSMTPLYCVSRSKTLACNSLIQVQRYTQRTFLLIVKKELHMIFTGDIVIRISIFNSIHVRMSECETFSEYLLNVFRTYCAVRDMYLLSQHRIRICIR